jgi:hypothetical protein
MHRQSQGRLIHTTSLALARFRNAVFRHAGLQTADVAPRVPITPANPICRGMIRDVNGTFNGVRLRRVISVGKTSDGRIARHTIRVLGAPLPELEQQLKLNEPGLLITGSQEIEGRIVDYHADLTGYDITSSRRIQGKILRARKLAREDLGCWRPSKNRLLLF